MTENEKLIIKTIREDRKAYRDTVLPLKLSHIAMNNIIAKEAWEEECSRLQSENAALREQISKMIMPPCTLGDTLYITSFCFGDGYDDAGNAVHTSGWQITETKVDEKNFYKMCDLVRNKKAFFSREAALARLAEMKGGKV